MIRIIAALLLLTILGLILCLDLGYLDVFLGDVGGIVNGLGEIAVFLLVGVALAAVYLGWSWIRGR